MGQVVIATIEDIQQALKPLIEDMFNAFQDKATQINNRAKTNDWLPISEARKILPYKSKKKWKELRDSAQIDFSVVGRGFMYSAQSIEAYINGNSTLKRKVQNGKR